MRTTHLLCLVFLGLVVSLNLTAQSTNPKIQITIKDSLGKELITKSFPSWNEAMRFRPPVEVRMNRASYEVAVTDKNGKKLTPALPNKNILSFIKSPNDENILIAGLMSEDYGGAKLYQSKDGGQIWSPLNKEESLSPDAFGVQAIALSDSDPNLVYASAARDGLYRSTNGGRSFSKVASFPAPEIQDMVIYPGQSDHILVASPSHGLVRSTDGGESWEPKEALDPFAPKDTFEASLIWSLTPSPFDPNTLYAPCVEGGVFKSTDFGKSWTRILELKMQAGVEVALNPENEQEIWILATNYQRDHSIFRSLDGGQNFKLIPNTTKDLILHIGFVPNSESVVFAGKSGLYRFKKDEIQKIDQTLPFPSMSKLLVVNGKVLVATAGNGIFQLEE